MKIRTAVILAIFASATQAWAQPARNWRVPNITEQARRLEIQPASEWSRVMGLEPGTRIAIVTSAQAPVIREFVGADETDLLVRDLARPEQPGDVQAIERICRADIRVIATTARRGSKIGALVGTGAGFLIGYASAVQLAFRQCGGSCDDERVMIVASLVAFPIAGTAIGYQVSKRTTQTIIYQAPQSR